MLYTWQGPAAPTALAGAGRTNCARPNKEVGSDFYYCGNVPFPAAWSHVIHVTGPRASTENMNKLGHTRPSYMNASTKGDTSEG